MTVLPSLNSKPNPSISELRFFEPSRKALSPYSAISMASVGQLSDGRRFKEVTYFTENYFCWRSDLTILAYSRFP